MNEHLQRIETKLNSSPIKDHLTPLFCETLLWGKANSAPFSRSVTFPNQQPVEIRFTPIAQLSGLPVLQADWPFDRLPNITQRRAVHRALSQTHLEHLLVYTASDQRKASFVWAQRRKDNKIELRSLPWEVDEPARTTVDQLAQIRFSLNELGMFGDPGIGAVTDKLKAAFDVESITRQFFRQYAEIFRQLEDSLVDQIKDDDERHMFTQRLFNRLLFLCFLQKRRWLNGDPAYLFNLFDRAEKEGGNFYQDYLFYLLFWGLNNIYEESPSGLNKEVLQNRIGEVPFLNGGLFELNAPWDVRGKITISNEVFQPLLGDGGLLRRYNFTVTESTPLDVEVAVDPEMLGKVFEELVTGRHESGSYYTPQPIVAFMCREGLKGYLETKCPAEGPEGIAQFVDDRSPGDLKDPEKVLTALRLVKVCDPACGSGAYLLGMMHELLELREVLFQQHKVDSRSVYDRKLEIIQTNLYGVDIDPFAAEIAKLRLWLSLVVDSDKPEPLPNLEFKIGVGDSLLAPDPSGGLDVDMFRRDQIQRFFKLKGEYLKAHGKEKATKKEEIEQLKETITAWAHPNSRHEGFDWAVEFAEVFAGDLAPQSTLTGAMAAIVNESPGQMELIQNQMTSRGFNIIIANPPYVNMFVLDSSPDEYREFLRSNFVTARGGFDLFVPFMERGCQLLSNGGMFAYITPNKLLSAEYAKSLREYFWKKLDLLALVDLSDIHVFNAAVYPYITLARKKTDLSANHQCKFFSTEQATGGEVLISLSHQVPNSLVNLSSAKSWSILTNPDAARLVNAFQNERNLDDVAEISASASVNEAYEWRQAIIDNGSGLNQKNPGRYPKFIVSGNIRRYYHTWDSSNVRYLKSSFSQPVIDLDDSNISNNRRKQILTKKIIISGMARRPRCFWDEGQICSGIPTIIVIPREIHGLVLTAILNSKLMDEIYHLLYGSLSLSGGYLRFGSPQIKKLPIPDISQEDQKAISVNHRLR